MRNRAILAGLLDLAIVITVAYAYDLDESMPLCYMLSDRFRVVWSVVLAVGAPVGLVLLASTAPSPARLTPLPKLILGLSAILVMLYSVLVIASLVQRGIDLAAPSVIILK